MDKLSSTIQILRSKPKCNISCIRLFPYHLANLQPVSQHLKWKFVFSGSIWLSWKRHWKRPTHPTEESKLIIRYYRESMLGEAQGSHQNYTVKRLFEKDRNSREIKTKRSYLHISLSPPHKQVGSHSIIRATILSSFPNQQQPSTRMSDGDAYTTVIQMKLWGFGW